MLLGMKGARELARQFPGDRFGSTIGRAGKELAPQGAAQKVQDRAGPLRTTAESLTPFLHESEIALAILRVVVRQEEDLALGEIADEVQNLAEGIVVEMADDRAFGMTKPVALSMEFCPDGDFQKEAVLILEPASAQELVALDREAREEKLVPVIRGGEERQALLIPLTPFQTGDFIQTDPVDFQTGTVELVLPKEEFDLGQAVRVGDAMMLGQNHQSSLGLADSGIVEFNEVTRGVPDQSVVGASSRATCSCRSGIRTIADGDNLIPVPRHRLRVVQLAPAPVHRRVHPQVGRQPKSRAVSDSQRANSAWAAPVAPTIVNLRGSGE